MYPVDHELTTRSGRFSYAGIKQPKAKPWAFGKTFNPLLKGSGDKRQSFNAFRYGR